MNISYDDNKSYYSVLKAQPRIDLNKVFNLNYYFKINLTTYSYLLYPRVLK